MKKIILLIMIITATISLIACSSCPVPPDAPRTYSLHLTSSDTVRK